jgi:anti-sigma28 factor (negative regulator of flagellin synthesis)
MTKPLSDAEIGIRLENAQAQLAEATDPERRRFLQRRVAALKANLARGTAGRTAATVLANENRA